MSTVFSLQSVPENGPIALHIKYSAADRLLCRIAGTVFPRSVHLFETVNTGDNTLAFIYADMVPGSDVKTTVAANDEH